LGLDAFFTSVASRAPTVDDVVPSSEIAMSTRYIVEPEFPSQWALTSISVSNFYASLKTVAQIGQPHAMAIRVITIRDDAGKLVERHWQPINSLKKGRGRNAGFLTAP
jgi:hypothetical protein